MPDYIDIPIETDPDTLAAVAFAMIQAAFPGWIPSPGNLETILVEANALMASIVANLASSVPTSIFRYFGPLVGVPPVDASPATVDSTWVMRDTAGYTIPAGTLIGVAASGDVLVPFQVVTDVVVAPGVSSTAAGGVTVVAVNPGAAGSGLGGTGVTATLIDPLDSVTSVTLTDVSTGGVDAETDSDYLDRLARQLRLLSPRPIIPSDFSALAESIAGVDRALALDGYDPTLGTDGNERTIAVAVIDTNGNPVSSGTKTAVANLLESLREVNFIVNVIDPVYTSIDVTFTVTVLPGFIGTDVLAAAEAAAARVLSPAHWGLPPTGDQRLWLNKPTVYYLEVATAIKNTQGVNEVTALTIGLHGGAPGAGNVALTGHAPLPQAGTITGALG